MSNYLLWIIQSKGLPPFEIKNNKVQLDLGYFTYY